MLDQYWVEIDLLRYKQQIDIAKAILIPIIVPTLFSLKLMSDWLCKIEFSECLPGFFNPSGSTCQACPVNTYKPALGDHSCTPCSTGTSTCGQIGQVNNTCGTQKILFEVCWSGLKLVKQVF